MIKKRIKECLFNPTEEEMFEREPLLKFSFYLSGRNNILLATIDEIIDYLDNGFGTSVINGGLIEKASTLLWFWTLGAYEMVRTISQAKVCFSDNFNSQILILKKELAKVRMPAAKMEKQGSEVPVNSNRSPDGWDVENKDLLIGDPYEPVSGRCLLGLYDQVLSSLEIKDVKKRHEESYKK